jgi:hypothetical protein
MTTGIYDLPSTIFDPQSTGWASTGMPFIYHPPSSIYHPRP